MCSICTMNRATNIKGPTPTQRINYVLKYLVWPSWHSCTHDVSTYLRGLTRVCLRHGEIICNGHPSICVNFVEEVWGPNIDSLEKVEVVGFLCSFDIVCYMA